ncbi:unnamed protein product [Rotaria sp. Silwood2]|nr:unnamed protein product [Rotaria sp. Silwood2]CAF4539671.1 unnamed protein product [Rotaria sp. Silwood2]
MLPDTTTTTTMDNSNVTLVNLQRHTSTISNTTIGRCHFLLIHLFFYSIVLIIVYVQLEQFNTKQETILALINSNHNQTFHPESHSQSFNHKYNHIDCSCQTFIYPKRNRTTYCLELHVGLNETISNVFCPMLHNNHTYNQWLLIQNRQTNSINFNRTWNEYRQGFGNIINQTDFWIGNENLYWLTNNYQCRLKIELTDWYNETRIAIYESFRILNHKDDYRIQISEYIGNMETYNKIDSFSRWHHNAPFSTYDHYATDNINCSNLHGNVGWWYHLGVECAYVQLNGRFPTHSDGLVPFNTGILWIGWKSNRHYSFQHVRMLIQPKLKRSHVRHR